MIIEIYSGIANYTRLPSDGEGREPQTGDSMRGLQDLRELNIYEIQTVVTFKVDYKNVLGNRDTSRDGKRYKNVCGLSFSIPGNYQEQLILEEVDSLADCQGLTEIATLADGQVEFLIPPESLHREVDDLGKSKPRGYVTIFTPEAEGTPLYYKATVSLVPYRSPYISPYAYTDGASVEDGRLEDYLLEDTYVPFGGGYVIYDENGQLVADSEVDYQDRTEAIRSGLCGIAANMGNANLVAELNTAMMVMRRADAMGMREITIFYDNEQIAASAVGGLNRKRRSDAAQAYYKFLLKASKNLKNLRLIRLIHAEAHRDEIIGEESTFPGNWEADQRADALRDHVMADFHKHRSDYLVHMRWGTESE